MYYIYWIKSFIILKNKLNKTSVNKYKNIKIKKSGILNKNPDSDGIITVKYSIKSKLDNNLSNDKSQLPVITWLISDTVESVKLPKAPPVRAVDALALLLFKLNLLLKLFKLLDKITLGDLRPIVAFDNLPIIPPTWSLPVIKIVLLLLKSRLTFETILDSEWPITPPTLLDDASIVIVSELSIKLLFKIEVLSETINDKNCMEFILIWKDILSIKYW